MGGPVPGSRDVGATPGTVPVRAAGGAAGNGARSAAEHPISHYFFSALLEARVRNEGEAKPFGRLWDIGVRDTGTYPQAVSLEVRTPGGQRRVLAWSAVKSLGASEIILRPGGEAALEADFWVRRDVLDDQVVDVSGARVLRVNDVHLLWAEGRLTLGHVEIGALGLLRRLGVERLAQFLMQWLFDYTIKDRFVSWRYVEVVAPGGSPGGMRMTAALATSLMEVRPAELADILEQLGTQDRQALFNTLSPEAAADTLEKVDPGVQRSLLSQEEPGKAADILEEMPSQEAADVLRDLHGPDAQRILNKMETGAAESVRTILAHEESTAGGVMSTLCIEAAPEEPAGQLMERVRRAAPEAEVLSHIYVLDPARRLLGVLTMRELLAAPPDAKVEDIMVREVVEARPDLRVADLARLFIKYGFRNIPVVDERGVFLGAVRLRHVLRAIGPLLKE